jgi:phosphatidylserine/phosphatidylglycerophosphate/cardiolipin synthase-like enzyme
MMENFVMPKLLAAMKESEIPKGQYDIMAYGTSDIKKLGGDEAQGKLHAKFWMVDNHSIGVGTSNFDPVSRRTNSEIMANVFPVKGNNSVEHLNNYYSELKSRSTNWSSDEFLEVKNHPNLRKNIIIQEFIAKILRRTDLLPQ